MTLVKTIIQTTIKENKVLSPMYYLLVLEAKEALPEIKAGQFAQLEIPDNKEIYLRRPFSIHDVQGQTISFLIKRMGRASGYLPELPVGTPLSVVGPLGNSFELNVKGKALLFGGGCGVAPLLLLAKKLKEQGVAPTVVLGGKTKDDIVQKAVYEKYAEVLVTTEDGSLGTKGFVTAVLDEINGADYATWYSCGPEAMQKGLAKLAKKYNVRYQVSLEGRMACGFGVCLCCVTKTTEGHQCVCSDGPVFEVEQLAW